MAQQTATVLIYRWIGAPTGGAPTSFIDITGVNTRANTYDGTDVTTYPIQIPDGTDPTAYNYSYWVNTRLQCTSAPAGSLDTVAWYTDGGANWLDYNIWCWGSNAIGYTQATGTPKTSGTALDRSVYPSLQIEPPTSVFQYTVGSVLPIMAGGYTITGPSGTGPFGDYMVYQVYINYLSTPGTSNQETFTFRYNES